MDGEVSSQANDGPARADLHVHSRFSMRRSNWLLRQMDVPESLADPQTIYHAARSRGMNFVTITDHDTLEGCLAIAHMPGVFLSAGVTVEFPEDGTQVGIQLYGLREAHLREVRGLRSNVYEVRDYVRQQRIVHAVTTPLELLTPRLTIDHFERLLVLFDHFEVRSGNRSERSSRALRTLFHHLTPDCIQNLADKWSISPASEQPWIKGLTGGSCDYSGTGAGKTFTQCPACDSPEAFLRHVAAKAGESVGATGDSVSAAHSKCVALLEWLRQSADSTGPHQSRILNGFLSRLVRSLPPQYRTRLQAAQLIRTAGRLLPAGGKTRAEKHLVREITRVYKELPSRRRQTPAGQDGVLADDRSFFELASRVTGQVGFRLASTAINDILNKRVVTGLQLLSLLPSVEVLLAPYLTSFSEQNRDRPLLRQIEQRFASAPAMRSRPIGQPNRAWFTDILVDISGVSRTVRNMQAAAERHNARLNVVSCLPGTRALQGRSYVNFEPAGGMVVPYYEELTVAVPPILEMLEFLEGADYTEYVVSTPWPVGLVGLLAAHLFHMPVRGIYHSALPQQISMIVEDRELEDLMWRFMKWFYGRCDTIWVQSGDSYHQLVAHGFPAERLRFFLHGIDLEEFNPEHRNGQFWSRWGANGRLVFLYAGRISRDKNLDTLIRSFLRDETLREKTSLAIVGKGPYLEELSRKYCDRSLVFTGFLDGIQLSQAYASADVFVFPSTTETFGNVVLEAQASGLPALVSDQGASHEIISPDQSGLVLPSTDTQAWTRAMRRLLSDENLRLEMGIRAREHAQRRDWDAAFREFWHDEPSSCDVNAHGI